MTSLSSLPLEIVDQICEYVGDVRNLALVGKQCYTLTVKHRFRRISITRKKIGNSTLSAEVKRWSDILEAASAFTIVRELSIFEWTTDIEECGEIEYPNFQTYADKLTRKDQLYTPIFSKLFDFKPRYEPEETWTSLMLLLRQLSGLQDLVWACESQFPPSLLQILHEQLPRCSLHIRAFKMPSLHQDADHPVDIDQRDYSLATSPNLCSILVPISHYDTFGCVEYNEEAAMEMAAGLAPNLKELHLVYGALGSSLEYVRALERGRSPWRGFFPLKAENDPKSQQPIRLQTLSISPATMQHFTPWEARLDFSALETLQLWDVQAETLMALSTHSGSLAMLKTLALHTESPEDRISQEYSADKAARLDDAATWFLSALGLGRVRLERVHLSGGPHLGKSFRQLLFSHGRSLRTLSLIAPARYAESGPRITVSRIKEIQTHCPHIQDLRLSLRRTHGNADEVAVYDALGKTTRLTCLTLQFHLLDQNPDSTSHSDSESPALAIEHDPEPSGETLISAAVDTPLARAIFTRIVKAGARSLQTLKILHADKLPPRHTPRLQVRV
ncbi:hypothetical protein BDW74DRAFT_181471 [Aspergillus multicolor]|uniref:uncharacterized protein n=1 Tax=Aspergillus multicolor TaxID=41759 RepID=UPI003CCD4E1B